MSDIAPVEVLSFLAVSHQKTTLIFVRMAAIVLIYYTRFMGKQHMIATKATDVLVHLS